MSSEPRAPAVVRVFISSPGDVAEERALAHRVIERLQGEFGSRATLEPIFWEHEPLRATLPWHDQIASPAEADIVICILWSRLGTRQPAELTRPDGSRYDSGTEFEFEEAWRSYQEKGRPDLLVYRKTREPRVSLKDRTELMGRIGQKEALDRFMDTWFQDREEGTLVAAFHPFDSSGDFEELFEVHLRKLLQRRLPSTAAGAEARTRIWTEGSPFRGLETFEFDHAPIFFGRTKATSEVLEALRVQADAGRPFVLVLGMSGCGKSSLARAGVLPLLTQPGVIEGVGLWRWAIVRPSDVAGDPFAGLATALLREQALPELAADGTGVETLAGVLRDSPEAAFPLLKGGLSQAAAELAREEGLDRQPEARLALVVDQLEELFTTAITQTERERFTQTLRALVESGRVWVLATLRSDLYPRSTDLPALVELKEGNGQYDLLPPTAAEIGQMIRQPTQLAGLVFEERKATGERLDDTLRDAAARNPEALPLLQFTLEELYTARSGEGELTFSAYEELGGVGGALAQRAEAAFGSLDPEEQAALPTALSRLVAVAPGGADGATRRRAPLEDFAVASPERALVDRFVEARLCVTDRDEGGRAVVSVAHEALLEHWPRLKEWLEHNRDLLRMRERLDAAAKQWEAEGRPASYLLASPQRLAEAEELERAAGIELPEREHDFLQASLARGRRTRWLKRAAVTALGVLTVLAIAGAWLASAKRQEAEIARSESEAVTDFLSDTLASVDPEELGREVLVKDVLDESSLKLDELADQPLIQARLMDTIGSVYIGLGLYPDATPLLVEALSTRENVLGPVHPDVAKSINNLAVLYARQGEFAEAEPLFERSLVNRERDLGPEDPGVADSLHNLANIYARLGKLEEAEGAFQRSLEIREKALGPDDPAVAMSLQSLGGLYEYQGKYEQAESLLLRSLEIREKALGPDHPHLADGLNGLAILYASQGKYAEAEPLFERTLEIREKALGPDHPAVGGILGNLAQLSFYQGKYEEAEPTFLRALQIKEAALGADNPRLSGELNNLGRLYWRQGKYAKAEPLYRRSLRIREAALGPDHPDVAYPLHDLGNLYRDQERYRDAEPLFERALAIREEALESDHPELIALLEHYAALLRATGRDEEAGELEARAKAAQGESDQEER